MDLPLYDEWESGGETYFVETPRNSGESRGDWEQRHQDTVDAMQALYPSRLMLKLPPSSKPRAGRAAVFTSLAACVGLGSTLAVAESLPTWARVAGGVVGLLATVLGVAVVWPTVRRMIHDDA